MSRTFTKLEGGKRRKLYSEIVKVTDELNRMIGDAIHGGITPDVSIHLMVPFSQPVIRVDFLRDEDAIQNE